MRKFFSAPVLADISLTNRCNLKCEYCYASSGDENKILSELSLDTYKLLFEQLDKMNVHRISLTGGEPLLRKDFFEILNEAQKYKFAIIINSNGILINDSIACKLKNYRFDRICITIDGSSSKTHDVIRGKGTFLKALQGIRSLQKYNLPVSTLFTLNKNNINDLIDTITITDI